MSTCVPVMWQKSSFSADASNCLELASTPDHTIRLRESDDPTTILTTTPTRLRALLRLTGTHSL